jgi:hypothetical protein
MESAPRPPNDFERALFEKLLSKEFPGRGELREQLQNVEVVEIDSYGSIRLRPSVLAHRAPVDTRVPVEGSGSDTDGVPIHLLVHVVDGLAVELEIYKADGSPILSMPPLDAIEVI